MDELSQEEIDALIDQADDDAAVEGESPAEATAAAGAAVHGDDPGELPETLGDRPVLRFDFNQPHNLGRRFERNVRGVCEAFTKVSTLGLTNLLRANTSVTFRELRLTSFAEEYGQLENPSCIAVASLSPMAGVALLVVDIGLMFSTFGKLLGGPVEEATVRRDFSEIEMGLARKVLSRVLEHWGTANEKMLELDPRLIQVENNPNYLNVFGDSETVLSLSYNVGVEPVSGALKLIVPMAAFEPVMEVFDPKEGLDLRDPRERQELRGRIGRVLERTGSVVSARFRERDVALAELLSLRPGSVLPLGHHVHSPLTVTVEGRPMFEGIAGEVGQARAVRIAGRMTEAS